MSERIEVTFGDVKKSKRAGKFNSDEGIGAGFYNLDCEVTKAEYAKNKEGKEIKSDMKFGDTYQQFRKDAKETITKLLGRGKNIIFIFHETTAEYVNESTDETYNVRQPNISDKILIEAIPALFDIVANIEIKVDDTGKKTRLLDCTMNKYKMTGNRFGIEDILTLDYKELESRIIKK